MRKLVGMASLIGLAACSGQDPQSAGSLAPTSSPLGTGATASTGTFVAPTETKTYKATGAVQAYGYAYTETVLSRKETVKNAAGQPILDANGFTTVAVNPNTATLVGRRQANQLYAANAATVRNPGITVSYDPRNAQFTLVINQNNVSQNIAFQDPAHRTDFGGAVEPQPGTPNLTPNGVRYLQVSLDPNVSDQATFFYEQPGSSTKYVTYAGFVRNRYEASGTAIGEDTTTSQTTNLTRRTVRERAAFVYGEQTANGAVPVTGTATYTGNMIASMANNPNFENTQQTYFQWIAGTQKTVVDFAAASVATTLTGTVGAPQLDTAISTLPVPAGVATAAVPIPQGSTFAAAAAARIDLVGTGGFTGQFSDAKFTTPAGAVQTVSIAGSSIDGAFYGPKAEEVGASFRVVGGVPDQRVDVIGSFTGKQP